MNINTANSKNSDSLASQQYIEPDAYNQQPQYIPDGFYEEETAPDYTTALAMLAAGSQRNNNGFLGKSAPMNTVLFGLLNGINSMQQRKAQERQIKKMTLLKALADAKKRQVLQSQDPYAIAEYDSELARAILNDRRDRELQDIDRQWQSGEKVKANKWDIEKQQRLWEYEREKDARSLKAALLKIQKEKEAAIEAEKRANLYAMRKSSLDQLVKGLNGESIRKIIEDPDYINKSRVSLKIPFLKTKLKPKFQIMKDDNRQKQL